jgi:hypothetical protein
LYALIVEGRFLRHIKQRILANDAARVGNHLWCLFLVEVSSWISIVKDEMKGLGIVMSVEVTW